MTTTLGAEPSTVSPPTCAHCGSIAAGKYCASCGSLVTGRRDLSVKHFLREAALAVTDWDSALIASFRALLVRPGELTASYLRGERHRFLPPFRVFLLCNLLYFVAVDQFNTTVLTAPLSVQMDQMTYRSVARAIMLKRYPALGQAATPGQQVRRKALREAITARYDSATLGIGKLIVVALIPFYALTLAILFIGTRRYFAEHLVFATHLVSFFLLVIPTSGIALIGWFYLVRLLVHVPIPDSELLYGGAMMFWFGTYAYVAQRTVYRSGRIATFVRTVLLAATVGPIIVAFKFALFLATLYWIT